MGHQAQGRHAAAGTTGNAVKYRRAKPRPREERVSELSTMPYIPPLSTFDIESGAHVATQVPPDESRFDRAWRDPEPDVPVQIPHMFDNDGGGHIVPGEGRSRSRRRPFVVLLMLLIAVGAGIAYIGYGAEVWGGKQVPNLEGISEAAARATLERHGFEVAVLPQLVDDGVGIVLTSDPAPGARVESGGAVTIVVGAARVVPEVAGLTEPEARQALVNAGALEVRVNYREWDAPEGTIVSVEPATGSTFTSRDVITLTVAQAFTVPELVGLNRRDATAAIEANGLVANVVEVPANGGIIGLVVETDPAAGTKLEPGAEVTVKVSSGTPTSFDHLAEYFGSAPSAIGAYVTGQGFTLKSGWLNDAGEAQAIYTHDERGTLMFTSRPFSHAFDASQGEATNDVLGEGHSFTGVRWEVPSSTLSATPALLSDSALSALVATCGFEGQNDSCNQSNIVVPVGTVKSGANFTCVSGEMNGLAWTVLVSDAAPARAVITCAPRSLYDSYELNLYGGRVCCMVAYADMYTEW